GVDNNSNVPIKVLDLDIDLVNVAAGENSSYALSSDGSLWVWGNNGFGQLGLGHFTHQQLPVQLLAPEGYVFTAIDAAYSHAVALIAPIPEPASFSLLTLGGLAT